MGGVVRAVALAAGVLLVAGCGLGVTGLGADVDASGDDAGLGDDGDDAVEAGDVGSDDGGSGEGATGEAAAGDGGAVVIAPAGAIASATGLAQQTHLVYATHSARWWLFFVDDAHPMLLQVRSSTDFVTWSPAASLTLPASHAGEGGNFTVAYADLGGADVVHLSFGLHFPAQNDRRHFHARATLSGVTITFQAPAQMTTVTDPALVDPDGPATLVASDGHVWDASGWAYYQGTGNMCAWDSAGVDYGTFWDGILGPQQNLATAQHTVNARALVPLAAGHVLALWELADAEPDPTNVAFSTFGGLSWTAGAPLFSGTTAQSANDWDVVHLTDTNVRVVRRALAGGFDDVRFDGSTWSALAAPTGDPGLAGSGVVLLGSAPRVAAFTIAGDAANSVRQAVWNGASWGPWTTLEGTPAARRFLSGWSSAGHAAVIWTQADGAGFDVAGKLVTF